MSDFRHPNDVERMRLLENAYNAAVAISLEYLEHYGLVGVEEQNEEFKKAVDELDKFDAELKKIQDEKQPHLPFKEFEQNLVCDISKEFQLCSEPCKNDAPCEIFAAGQ